MNIPQTNQFDPPVLMFQCRRLIFFRDGMESHFNIARFLSRFKPDIRIDTVDIPNIAPCLRNSRIRQQEVIMQMRIIRHIGNHARHLEMLFGRRCTESQHFADRITTGKITTCSTFGNHHRIRTDQLSTLLPLEDREIEEIEKSRFGITVLFFDKLPVTERHLLPAILCRHTYILLYARNLAIHGGSMPERSRRPIIRQGCPFIKTALHTVDVIPVVERIETQFEPYIEHNQQRRANTNGKTEHIQGGKRLPRPLAFDYLRPIFHQRKINRSFSPNKSYPEIITFSPGCNPSTTS